MTINATGASAKRELLDAVLHLRSAERSLERARDKVSPRYRPTLEQVAAHARRLRVAIDKTARRACR